ncbi:MULTISPECIES: Rsd/AlgQ family anti-sigma factor [Marinobacter]|jgi:regulator of sigma D|uniref:Rsd/AlgQ family anti-sigma factor n=2 Tax=Marinobacter TaxID=2742 RepID=A0ABV4W3Q4_9GAMM|nr:MULTISPECIES: Rsd/AlgQ family anti-sigma factor [Marinobacter]AMQ89643.1 transcriptional regulator [Marinobacter sp. LQ44]MAO14506.1 Rsd/AlgQ family anti-sigma factor [Marinobacter sp.]MCD1629376.1 Rsd/AlgQ family anti-sigma factor [Marinobacter shengliensis]WBU41749.1 Rsd/AlgQ family anti-sigma factor [Marinobacter alkaliphilus]|tara:strand:- start:403 stop:882 length:480 start_codon:yes stop_codon:yes gene_type:complete
MLENCRNARERWGGVSELIDRWLKERQELLVRYCDLSTETDFSQTEMLRDKFVRLCEVLVDYVSAGHFEVYEQLIQEAREFNDGGLELAAKVYPRIEQTTGVALNFNDRVDGRLLTEGDVRELFSELSKLGEVLESRFEMEDFLIEHLHNAHAGKMASA